MKAGLWCVLHDSESEAVENLKTGCRVWETSVENYVCCLLCAKDVYCTTASKFCRDFIFHFCVVIHAYNWN